MDSTQNNSATLHPVTPEEVAEDLGIRDGSLPLEEIQKLRRRTHAEGADGRKLPLVIDQVQHKKAPTKLQRLLYLDWMSGKYSKEELAVKYGYNSILGMSNTIRKVHRWTQKNWQIDTEHLRSKHDMDLRQVHEMALTAYRESAKPRKVKKRKAGVSGGVDVDMREVTTEERVGDPRYLNVALGALSQLQQLHGLDAPKKVAHTGHDGGPLKMEMLHKKLTEASDEELAKLRQANRVLVKIQHQAEAVDAEFEVKDADSSTDSGNRAGELPTRL